MINNNNNNDEDILDNKKLQRMYREMIEKRRKGNVGRTLPCARCNGKEIHTDELFHHLINFHHDPNAIAASEIITMTQSALFGKLDWNVSDFLSDENLDAVKRIIKQRNNPDDLPV